jgi:hypothetical protein
MGDRIERDAPSQGDEAPALLDGKRQKVRIGNLAGAQDRIRSHAGCESMRMHPFCVMGQQAQPASISLASQRVARS